MFIMAESAFSLSSSLVWLIVFVMLVMMEVATMGLTTIWFAIGALVAFILALCGVIWQVQLLVFILVSLVMLIFTRPILKKRLNRSTVRTNADRLVGQTALVTVMIDNLSARGAAEINGQEWTARSTNPEVKMAVGQKVRIVEISGVKLMVEPINEIDQKAD